MSALLLSVVLCGGSGTRLWPLSRETYPKQFLALTDEITMLQHTVVRLKDLAGRIPQAPKPLLVCNEQHRFLAASQLLQIGLEQCPILLEPAGRNTAPALTLAALQASVEHDDPVLLAMPADHMITESGAFHAAVERAYSAAIRGCMVTFGIVAVRPETGYGYIHYGQSDEDGLHAVQGFKEKPTAAQARCYLDAGDHLWNSGLFMVRASVWLRAIAACRPDILEACSAAMRSACRDVDFIRPVADAFLSCPSDSIDYAVMERLPIMPSLGIPALVVPLDAGWSDLGAWDALWDVHDKDERDNSLSGNVLQRHCDNSLLMSSSRLVVGVGLENMVVIETPDAVLVADKRQTQEVKQMVTLLAGSENGQTFTRSHRKVHRPWGWYDSLDRGERFQVKRIVVNPGASLSLQMHNHRAEHWVVVKGMAEVTRDEQCFFLNENESTYIPRGHKHRLKNPGKFPLEIIEIQSGDLLSEDDIVRFDDAYGRVIRGR